jgi:DNA-binding HxlR family transcriptional regulator
MLKIQPDSPLKTTLSLLDNYRKFLIVGSLLGGKKRFSELARTSGFNPRNKLLIKNLRGLMQGGLVERKVYAQVPPKVEYGLTELGHSLKPVIKAMAKWGEAHGEIEPDGLGGAPPAEGDA